MVSPALGLAWATLLAVSGVYAWVGVVIYRRSDAPGTRSFVAFCVTMAVTLAAFFTMGVVGEFVPTVLATVGELMFVLLTASTIFGFNAAGLAAPLLWARFALTYTGQRVPTDRRTMVVVGLPVIVTVTLLVGAIVTPLLTRRVSISVPTVVAESTLTYAIRVTTFYLFALLVAGASLIGWTGYNYHHFSTKGGALLGVSGVLPWAAVAIPRATETLDGAALRYHAAVGGFLGATALLAAVYRYDLFENLPAAGTVGRDVTVEDMTDPVIVTDEDQQVLDVNPAAQEQFDLGVDAIGTSLDSVLGAAVDTDRVLAAAHHEFELDAGTRTIAATRSRLDDEYGRTLGYSIVFHDVTERKRRQERIQVLNRILRHNLRNDMSAVKAYAEVLAEDPVEHRERAIDIQAIADDLTAIGEKARDIERIVAADDYGTAPLADVVKEVLAAVRQDHPHCQFEATTPEAAVHVERRVLTAVLRELLDNAARHSDVDKPTVQLRATAGPGDALTITVTDDGPGIPEHELAPIRTGTETDLQHGSGLGLWLVRWGVATMGGTVEFADGEPRGSTVTIELPADGE